MFFASEFEAGMRVEIQPGAPGWSDDDKSGTVVKTTRTRVFIQMQGSGRVVRCSPQTLLPRVSRAAW